MPNAGDDGRLDGHARQDGVAARRPDACRELVDALSDRFPRALLQFEDFATRPALGQVKTGPPGLLLIVAEFTRYVNAETGLQEVTIPVG